MAKAGVISIDINAETAQFLVNMDKANVKLQQFGKGAQEAGIHTVTSMQASSAAIRELAGGSNVRAIERLISLFPALANAAKVAFLPIAGIAFGVMLVDLGKKAVEFFQKMEQAPARMAAAFRGLEQPLQLTNDELDLSNAKLTNEIAKLEEKPQNGLAVALAEAKVEADKLADALDKDLDRIHKVMAENKPRFSWLVGTGTTDADKRSVELQGTLASHEGNPGSQIQDIREELAKVQSDLASAATRAANVKTGQAGSLADWPAITARLNTYVTNYQAEIDRLTAGIENSAKTQKRDQDEAAKANAEAAKRIADQQLRQKEEEAREQERVYEESRRVWAETQRDKQEEQDQLNAWAQKLHDTYARVATETREIQDRMNKDGAESHAKFTENFQKTMAETGKKEPEGIFPINIPLSQRLTGPVKAAVDLHAAGGNSAQQMQAEIGEQQQLLSLMRAGGAPLGEQLSQREKILEDQIALNASEGKSTDQLQLQLAGLKAQQTLRQWSQQGAGSMAASGINSAMQVPAALGDALAKGIFGGGKKGEDVGKQIGDAMKQIGLHLLGQVMTQMIEKLIATTVGQFLANMLNNWMIHYASNPLGLFAEGGRPAPGVPYIVGEKGPEVRIDDKPGSIIPNHMMSRPSGYARMTVSPDARNSSYGGHTFNQTNHIYESDDAQETGRHLTNLMKTMIPSAAQYSS